ncbi:MFS transporter [Microvirga makkahensis]|uniref:MFS transporter n=1 Tax=Microvirga makkahensis TaxID=1128670 RepID=A0A7X3MUR2_9HYPH|nr:MFS transporter [Microvirga makkahensis]MXQ13516.1 MFS transporter [Microvirga makkahensis]
MSGRQKSAAASPEWGLAGVYAVSIMARTTVMALIPVMAYHILGTAQHVSELYFAASLIGIAVSLCLPNLLLRLGRWPVFISAAAGGIGSAATLASGTLPGLAAGLVLHVLMVLVFENVMSLYVLQYVPRRSLSAFEPRRVLLAGVAYGLGPWLGAWLTENVGAWSPLTLSAACAIVVPLSIILLKPISEPRMPAPSKGVGHSDVRLFLSQPRLRLAWLLATMRASWWCMYIVYTPILAVSQGLGASVGGLMISIGSALLMLAPFWRRVVEMTGMRRLLLGAYAVSGVGTLATGFLSEVSVWASVAMLLFSAFAMSAIDAIGNVPFLRAVRPHQRMALTPIYNTYRDVAQVAPAGLFAILLMALPLPSVFIMTGALMVLASGFCRYLPRRL